MEQKLKIGTLFGEGQTWEQVANLLILEAIYKATLEAFFEYTELVGKESVIEEQVVRGAYKERSNMKCLIRKLYREWNTYAEDFPQDFWATNHAQIYEELFKGEDGHYVFETRPKRKEG